MREGLRQGLKDQVRTKGRKKKSIELVCRVRRDKRQNGMNGIGVGRERLRGHSHTVDEA